MLSFSRSCSHLRPLFSSKTRSNLLKNALNHSQTRSLRSTALKYNLNEPKTVSEPVTEPSLLNRLLYRPDGSPRSKKKGILIGTLGLSLIFLIKISVDLEDFFYRVDAVLEISSTDSLEYDSTDWNSYAQTCSYFHKICAPILVKPGYAKPEDVQVFFTRLAGMQFDNFGQQKVHGIMRDAAKEIHKSLDNPQEVPKLKEMGEILRSALEMVEAELHLQEKNSEDLSSWIKSLKEGERKWK
ncbi:hypothetical protein VKT23_015492 [Stygiomarasmius scandens]|uniref:Uncharacterized protein n=1 Tax=Marasmiellus scandens TaxID=2682957 RepID=A0ABR1IXU3_9AGAR